MNFWWNFMLSIFFFFFFFQIFVRYFWYFPKDLNPWFNYKMKFELYWHYPSLIDFSWDGAIEYQYCGSEGSVDWVLSVEWRSEVGNKFWKHLSFSIRRTSLVNLNSPKLGILNGLVNPQSRFWINLLPTTWFNHSQLYT